MNRISVVLGLLIASTIGYGQQPAISGMYVLEFPGQNLRPVTKYIMNQKAVRGGNVFVVWSDVDSGNGQYDWSSVDGRIAPWAAIHKPVNLIVWGVDQSTPNTGTPAYVLKDPGYQSVRCASRGRVVAYPVYYSAGYKNHFKTFIGAVLNRYGKDARIGYVRFGLARGGEAFPTCLTEMMQKGGYSTLSQFNTVWENYIAEMTLFQTGVPHAVQLLAALNQYGQPIQWEVCGREADNAVGLGFGFGSQGLSLDDVNAYNSGGHCTSDWCSAFHTYQDRVPLEMQTIAASDPANLRGGTGSMTVLLPFGLSLGADVFEVYIEDWRVAFDPTSPRYAKYGAGYRAAFSQTAASLGY